MYEIRETDVSVGGGKILGFSHTEAVKVVDARGAYLLPGLIDAHIHIESSMVSPARFAGRREKCRFPQTSFKKKSGRGRCFKMTSKRAFLRRF